MQIHRWILASRRPRRNRNLVMASMISSWHAPDVEIAANRGRLQANKTGEGPMLPVIPVLPVMMRSVVRSFAIAACTVLALPAGSLAAEMRGVTATEIRIG